MALQLPYDSIDDLIYDARVGDLPSLQSTMTALATQHSCSPLDILAAAIDIDADGEGTGCCLLHWPGANGNEETLSYLLSLIPEKSHPLLSHANKQGNTPLHWSVLNLHIPCVKALVSAGADINAKNAAGQWVGFEAERIYEEGESDAAPESTEGNEAGEQKEPVETERQKKAREIIEFLLSCDGFREGGENENGEIRVAAGTAVKEGEKADVEMSG